MVRGSFGHGVSAVLAVGGQHSGSCCTAVLLYCCTAVHAVHLYCSTDVLLYYCTAFCLAFIEQEAAVEEVQWVQWSGGAVHCSKLKCTTLHCTVMHCTTLQGLT